MKGEKIMTSKSKVPTEAGSYNRRDALKLMGVTLASGLTTLMLSKLKKSQDDVSNTVSPYQKISFGQNTQVDQRDFATKQIQPNGKSPNIIFILGDNHHFQTMGCAGHPFIQTPGMDQIAKEGIIFENTFSPTPLCSPSRATFLTGAYAHKHNVKNNHTPWTGQMTTFLEYLSLNGYATAFIGKWHMPGEGLPEMPFLDLFVSYTYREGQGAYFNCPMIVDGEEVPSRKPYITEEITDYAIEFIQANLAQDEESRPPFCIYLAHRPGHPPYQAPDEISGMYDNADVNQVLPDLVDPWWYGKANRNVFQGIMMGSYYNQYRKYCETLTAMDRDIVRILEKLDQEGLRENTIVIYMGDNGMQWGTHDCHGIREPYEESIRLPFIIRAPWLIPDPGMRRGQVALNIDIAPTLLEIAGVPIPQEMDGENLVPILLNPEVQGRDSFLLEFWRYFPENTPSYTGIRTQNYKYVEFERGRKPWLFDLQKDPEEQTNLYNTSEGKKILPELKSIMESY
jgi:N-acetylglucosamine-6-sulfatase